MSRALTFLGIFQLACLLIGFFTLGIILKVNGYPDEPPMVRWSPFAIFLRSQGLWLLAVPALWVSYAVYSSHRDKGLFSERTSIVVGIIISGVIILSFLYAAIFPIGRWMLILP